MPVLDSGNPKRVALRRLCLCLAASIACDRAPDPGTVIVSFSTSPGDESPFVWGVAIDGASPHNITSADTGKFTLPSVSAGDHHLIASSLPKLCTTGQDDRTVTVPTKDTLRVTFALKCARSTGDISVTIQTVGSDLDPDGYQLTLNGTARQAVGAVASTTVTLAKLAPATYDVSLTGLAPNCSMSASSQHSAVVTAGSVATVTILVNCASLKGTIHVVTTTTGTNLDPNGYVLTVPGNTPAEIGNNATADFLVDPGVSYNVVLSDLE